VGIISDFVVGTREEALLYYQRGWTDEGRLPPGLQWAQYKNYLPPQLDMLWADLSGERWDWERHKFEHVCHEDDGSQSLDRFPDAFVSLLAGVDDARLIETLAGWAEREEVLGTAGDHVSAMHELRSLAQSAGTSGKGLYLYLSL